MRRATENEWSGAHGRFNVTGTAGMSFMHGGKRAPTRMRALPEGPNIGLTTGYAHIGVENLMLNPREVNLRETRQGYPVPGHSPPIRK